MGTMFGNVNSDYAEGKGPVVTGKQKSSNAGESARRNAMTTKSVSVPTQSAEVLGSRVEKTDTPTNTVSVGTTPVEKKPVISDAFGNVGDLLKLALSGKADSPEYAATLAALQSAGDALKK